MKFRIARRKAVRSWLVERRPAVLDGVSERQAWWRGVGYAL